MKFRIKTVAALFIITGIFVIPVKTFAQWQVGASYEIRQEEPRNGFGLRLERHVLNKLPIADLALRAHFSYFSDENGVDKQGVSYGKIENYDYGLTAIGGVALGLIEPYVGLGVGSATFDVDYNDVVNSGSESDSNLFWNALIGAQVSPIPMLKPFVEYRFQETDEPKFVKSSNGRLVFGLALSF